MLRTLLKVNEFYHFTDNTIFFITLTLAFGGNRELANTETSPKVSKYGSFSLSFSWQLRADLFWFVRVSLHSFFGIRVLGIFKEVQEYVRDTL